MHIHLARMPEFRHHRMLAPAALAGSGVWCGKMRCAHFSTPHTRSPMRRSRTSARRESEDAEQQIHSDGDRESLVMKRTTPTPEESILPVQPKSRLQTFRALQYRDFRLLWIGLVISSVGTWMQIIAQSLLVLHITHGNALALGVVSLAQALSFFLFALLGGSVADQIDKRRLLLFTQSMSMLLAFLTYAGVIQVWMIVLLAFCSGTVLSFDQPSRSALIPILVPRENLMNAISLQSIVFNGAAVFGPALAGATIGIIGYAGNFFLNGVSYLGVLLALYVMRVPEEAAKQSTERRGPLLNSILAALGAVRRDIALPWILSGYGALLFFG